MLLVEDNVIFGKNFSAILQDRGYSVFWATSGSKAIAELARDFFKVVFLDIRLADIDGIEVLRAVKKNSPLTRIVVISATQPERLREEWKSEGTFTYLGKPFDIDQVLRILEDMGKGTEHGES